MASQQCAVMLDNDAGPVLGASTGPALTAQYWADFHFGAGAALAASSTSTLAASDDSLQCQHSMRIGKSQIFMFFNSGYAHDRNISIFRRRASTVTGNTLIKPKYASVRLSTDSLHPGTHKVTKKVAAAPCSETA